jgi:hypothetical protein
MRPGLAKFEAIKQDLMAAFRRFECKSSPTRKNAHSAAPWHHAHVGQCQERPGISRVGAARCLLPSIYEPPMAIDQLVAERKSSPCTVVTPWWEITDAVPRYDEGILTNDGAESSTP